MEKFKSVLKRTSATIMVVVMLISAAPLDGFVGMDWSWLDFGINVSAATNLASTGQCGDDVYWNYDSSTRELVISGSGAMWDLKDSTHSFIDYDMGIITITEGVTTISDRAFYGCIYLTTITIPDSIIVIGAEAFYGCHSLSSINIPESVKTIGSGAFSYCSKLTYINVDEDNTEYSISDNGVLFDKNKTTLIQYPAGKRDRSYIIPDNITTIGEGAFSSCVYLTTITIPDSVATIGDRAFSSCENLTGINIPKSVKSIGNIPFGYCLKLRYITVDLDNTAYSNDSGVLFDKNKTTLIQYPAGKNATSYTIPDSVTTIGDWAFSYCDILENIAISDNVTAIGKNAFYSCDGLTSIIIPDKVTTIGESAFGHCSFITSITIGKGVTIIDKNAFDYCTSLEGITIPDNVITIGEGVFSNCYKLVSVVIGKGVTTIAVGAFDSSTKNLTRITVDANNTAYSSDRNGVLFNKTQTILIHYPIGRIETSYTMPDSVSTIYESAFYDCDNLTSVTIGKSVTKIGDRAFTHCNNLASITIPDGVISIGDGAFAVCSTLASVIVPDSVAYIGNGVFSSCAGLTKVTLSNSMIKIPDNTFYSCTNLKSATIPDGVREVGEKAFSNCSSLECISIPKSLTRIYAGAFYKCDYLKSVYYRGTEDQWNEIDVSSGNDGLLNGTIYYNYSGYIVGDIIEFGSYPQSEVKDDNVISALNSRAPAWEDWTSYGYYSGDGNYGSMVQGDWMRYTDITYNGTKYRGVKFTQYRPSSTYYESSDNSRQKINGYETDTVYWFKFEPIYWRVLDPDTGLVMSENVIDCQPYSNLIYEVNGFWMAVFESYTRYFMSPSTSWGGFYANNYDVSYIRNWLNDNFYETAFDSTEKKEVLLSTIANDGGHISVPDTEDRVFLLSEGEVTDRSSFLDAYTADLSRLAKPSDYAKAQGVIITEDKLSESILRSAVSGRSGSCVRSGLRVRSNGTVIGVNVSVCSGIRPAAKFGFVSRILGQTNQSVNTKNTNQKITITPKDASGSWLDDTSSFSSFACNAFESMSDVKINSNLGDSVINGTFTAKKSDIESKDIVLSRDNYYNYIIPKEVISSWSTSKNTAYKFDALMQKDKKDGKPYVSTVFGRESDKGAYKELKINKLSVFEDKKYDIIISAGGLNGKSATYYISQDNAHRISSSNGVFDSKVLYTVLDYSKDTYAYFITSDGIVSDPIKIKIEKSVPQDDYTQKLLSGSEISLVGKDGQKIKIGEDFPLVGGAEISLEAFKFPLVGIDVNGDNVKISLGIDVFSTKESDSQKRETTWLDYKKGIKTLGDKYNDSKDALQHYRNFAKTFIDKNGLKQSSFIDSKSNFNLSLLGYLEGTIINGKIVFKEALIKVEGKFTFRYTQQGAIWVIPAYVYIEGSSKVGLTGNKARQFADTNIPLDFGLMLDIEPALKIGAGAGVKNAASLGLWGKGSLPYHNDFSEKYHNLHLKGEFGWEAEFFIVSAEGTLLEGEFKLFDSYYGKTKKSFLSFKNDCLRNSLKQNQPTVSVSSRDYAENTSEWLGEYPISLYSLADNGVSFSVLQTSIFGQSNPQLVSFGDNVMMVWVQDDTSRDTYNRMELVYSLYDSENDSWSEPKTVYDDGHNDAYPSLATDGENVYVAWQKIDKTVTASDATSTDVFLENSEIYVAKYDASNDCFVNATKLTDNDIYDYFPSLIVNNGNAVVYYASNEDNNLMDTDNNTLYRHEIGEAAEILADKQSYIISTTPEIVNGTEKLSYSVDTDGDMSTSDDITVYTISNGSTTSFDKAENDVAYTFAEYSMLDGKETLFVSDMNNIYYEQDGETKSIFAYYRQIEGNISFIEQETGLSILWTENNESGGNDFWTTSYEDDTWTEPVQISNIGSFKVSNVDVAMLGGKLVGICNMNEMMFDDETETYAEGEANLCSFTANEFTDISLDIYMVDEEKIIPGETSEIDVYVNNVGTTNVGTIKFVISDTLGTNTTITKEVNLKSGSTKLVTLDYPVPENYASTTLAVSASIPDVEESDITDNTETIEIGKGDLSVIQTELVNFGNNYILKAVVENNSAVNANGVVVSSIFNDSENEPFEQSKIGSLAKEQYVDYELAFNKELVEFDENGVGKLYLNVTSSSDESADGDNQVCIAVTLPKETVCGHPLTETVEAKEATCAEVGYSEYEVCVVCSEKIGYAEIPNSHSEINHEAKAATCTEIGWDSYVTCSRCDYTTYEEIPAKDHDYESVVTEPTCTEEGFTICTCACGDTYTADSVDSLGHDEELHNAKTATCTEIGWDSYVTCSRCDYTTYEEIPAKDHNYKSIVTKPTCTKKGYTTHICSDCGNSYKDTYVNAKGHNYTSKVTKTATCTTAGIKTFTCSCGDSYTESIKATGHKEVTVAGKAATYTTEGKTAGKKCSVCGTITVKPTTVAKLTLGKVSGLKAKKVKVAKSSEITLAWNSLGEGVKYEIYQQNGKKWKKIKTTSSTSYPVKKLKADKSYKFKVRAVVDGANGAYSSVLTVKTVPATTSKLTLKTGKKQLTASWKSVSDISGYEVQYSTSKKFTKKTTKTINSKKSSKKTTIKKLAKGKKYYVRVRTYKTVNGKKIYSSWSTVKNVKVK